MQVDTDDSSWIPNEEDSKRVMAIISELKDIVDRNTCCNCLVNTISEKADKVAIR